MQDRGIPMEDIYIDTTSGKTAPSVRVAYRKLKDRIESGSIEEIIISEYTRIGRDVIESLSEVLDIMRRGIRIQSLSEHERGINEYPTVSMQLIAITLSLDSAQRERSHIQERTKWGLERAKAAGKKLGRPERPVDLEAVAKLAKEKNLKELQAVRVLGIKPRTFYAAKKAAKDSANIPIIDPKRGENAT